MTDRELNDFLAEPQHLLRLGTNGTDGIPRVVPIWYIHEEGKIWFTPRARSAWFDDLREDPRVCAAIDEETGTMRKLIARGTAVIEHEVGDDDAWRDIYRRITLRYTPETFADAYLTDTHDEPRGLCSLELSSAHCNTWRMPVEGEDRLAVWAPKYYHRDDSKQA